MLQRAFRLPYGTQPRRITSKLTGARYRVRFSVSLAFDYFLGAAITQG